MSNGSDLLLHLEQVIRHRKQLLLTGSSGVGKTYYARQLAGKLTGADEQSGKWALVSVHPSYSYEDFVHGIVVKTVGQKPSYQSVDKVLIELVKAANEEPDGKQNYVLILDDIGRANLASILGELLYALEYRSEGITLKDGTVHRIPDNFYLIATYNTALRYENTPDYALLRRFDVVDIPNELPFANAETTEIQELLSYLPPELKEQASRYMPGRGYFSDDARKAAMKKRYMIAPLIRQYVKDGLLQEVPEHRLQALEKNNDTRFTLDYEDVKPFDLDIAKSGNTIEMEDLKDPFGVKPKGTMATDRHGRRQDVKLRNFVECMVDTMLVNNLLSNSLVAEKILLNKRVLLTRNLQHDVYGALWVPFEKNEWLNGTDNAQRYSDTAAYTINGRDYSIFVRPAYKEDPLTLARPGKSKKSIKTSLPGIMNELQTLRLEEISPDENAAHINAILFKMVYVYYTEYIKLLTQFIENPAHEPESVVLNLQRLRDYAQREIISFQEQVPDQDFYALWKLISGLPLLRAKPGDRLRDESGHTITVTGVYQLVDQYMKVMNELGVRQMILHGPPGTSKTFTAKQIIVKEIMAEEAKRIEEKGGEWSGSEDEWSQKLEQYKLPSDPSVVPLRKEVPVYWDIVQFHPSYGYEDFVRGITVKTENTQPVYDTVDMVLGRIARAAQQAKEEETGQKFFLIIDEINRANMATVFGELIYALEYRGQPVRTPYEVKGSDFITIPDNLYMIGTMNTADKSIGGMDYAIRRRFVFFPCLPREEVIDNAHARKLYLEMKKFFIKEKDQPEHLSPDYYADDVQIGHTYFLLEDKETALNEDQKLQRLEHRFIYQIVPILREYYKDGVLIDDHKQPLPDYVTKPLSLNDAKQAFRKILGLPNE